MKCNRFYPLFFIALFLILMVSCTQDKSAASRETLLVISKINHCLEQVKSDDLSTQQKLECINESQTLAEKANIDSLILKTFNEKAEFYNVFYPDSALTVLKEFEKMANTIHIEYSDNGTGIASDKIVLKNGLQNVENRIESIKGKINFDPTSGKGFKVSLSIPV